jgi:hypothetical protein
MTFSLLELSRWFGQPVHLFRFSRGTSVWRFTSGDEVITLDDGDYLPAAISRTSIRESVEYAKNNVTIRFPYSLDPNASNLPVTQTLGNLWRPFPPSERVFVDCMALHRGDDEVNMEWTGRVLAPKLRDTSLELTCEPSRSSGRRTGKQLRWQRNCTLTLYSQGVGQCNLDKASRAVAVTGINVVGLTLNAVAFGTVSGGRLAGGIFEWTRPDGGLESRTIMAHLGTSIVVNYGGPGLTSGMTGTAYLGCAHNWEACEDHENTDNYGGNKYAPVQNPWSGQPVW